MIKRSCVALGHLHIVDDEFVAINLGAAVDIRFDSGKNEWTTENITELNTGNALRSAGMAAIIFRGLDGPSGKLSGLSADVPARAVRRAGTI